MILRGAEVAKSQLSRHIEDAMSAALPGGTVPVEVTIASERGNQRL